MLLKLLNLVLKYEKINELNKKHFYSKTLRDKLFCKYQSSTKEVSLQVINTKMNTKTARSHRVSVQKINRKVLQFYKGYFTNIYQMKVLENKPFCKFLGKLCNRSRILDYF